jgi:hypothetical protein
MTHHDFEDFDDHERDHEEMVIESMDGWPPTSTASQDSMAIDLSPQDDELDEPGSPQRINPKGSPQLGPKAGAANPNA